MLAECVFPAADRLAFSVIGLHGILAHFVAGVTFLGAPMSTRFGGRTIRDANIVRVRDVGMARNEARMVASWDVLGHLDSACNGEKILVLPAGQLCFHMTALKLQVEVCDHDFTVQRALLSTRTLA